MSDSGSDFTVSWDLAAPDVRAVRERLRQAELAEKLRFRAALSEFRQELARSPLEWGEPKYELKVIKLMVCIGFSHRYRIMFGVDSIRRIVLIRSFRDWHE